MEIAIIKKETIAELTNKELKKSLNTINTASNAMGKACWKVADELASIVTGETYADDFGTLEKLGKAVGMSESYIYRLVKASDMHKLEVFASLTVSKTIELLPILDWDVEVQEEFVKAYNFEEMSRDAIREAVRDWNNVTDADELAPTEGEEAEEAEAEETPEATVETTTKEITVNGTTYHIAVEDYNEILTILGAYAV